MIGNFHIAFVGLCFLVVASMAYSQGSQTDLWTRIGSDDGEFSIDVPTDHRFFFDEDGFSVANTSGDLTMERMEMLTAIIGNTLVSFERYEARKEALQKIYELDKSRKDVSGTREFKVNGARINQIVVKTDRYLSIREYFYTAAHVYILTAASREGETSDMRRFLDSLAVSGRSVSNLGTAPATPFSQLKKLDIEIEDLTNTKPVVSTASAQPDNLLRLKKPGPNDMPLIIVAKPLASYVDPARAARTKGTVVIKVTFSEDGTIPKVAVIKGLPNGLVRQAIFAALRMKFLPFEDDGKRESSVKSVEYNFDIY
jgi:hypothetical protein